jgi:hypothetical protein
MVGFNRYNIIASGNLTYSYGTWTMKIDEPFIDDV